MKKLQGFTLAEVIIVVAVLAVVLTMAMPDMTRLFSKQQEMMESLRLKDIHKALELYSKKYKKLPDDSGDTWASELVEYTELSVDQILKDMWGEPRTYSLFTDEVSYFNSNNKYKVYYGVVHSKGRNKNLDVSLPLGLNDFKTFDVTYNAAGKRADDLAIKYTDQAYKISLLEETLRRMEKLSTALAKYARVKQITGANKYPYVADRLIYFPEDGKAGDPGDYFKNGTNLPPIATGASSVTISISSDEGVDSLSGNANEARALASLLGLPSYYGENALTDETMWYISNPGPNGDNICSGRRSEAPFYPPIIMINENASYQAVNPC